MKIEFTVYLFFSKKKYLYLLISINYEKGDA